MLINIKKVWRIFCDHLPTNSLNITIMVSVLLIIVLLGTTTHLYMQSPSTIAYKQELQEYFQQENAKQDFKRLHKYHGYPPVVVYEEGKRPYFYDKLGKKSAFVYPSKGSELIVHQAEDSDYYVKMVLNEKPMVK
jgi:hypothetical protein